MTKPMDHVAYLSQEIGARPAGTEEEQLAALYIADQLRNDAHLTADVEDFTCLTSANLPKAICGGVAVVSAIAAMALPQMAVPALIATLAALVLTVCEVLDKPMLSRLFMRGVSQNIVAKYEPTYSPDGAGARRRKIIVTANYDSGKVSREHSRAFVKISAPLKVAALVGMAVLPVLLALRAFVFASASAEIIITINVLMGVAAALVAVQLLFMLLDKLAPYNEAATSNASGVAVMLEVARRIGNGEAGAAPISDSGFIYGEDAARAAGVIPDGAEVSYEDSAEEPADGLAAAKAAIAAMTGQSVPGAARSFDIAANLVQVKDVPIAQPTDEDMAKSREEAKAALSSVPAGTIAEALENAADRDTAETADGAAGVAAAGAGVAAAAGTAGAVAEAAGQAASSAERAAAESAASVPEWYRKATEKAKKKDVGPTAGQRSRYADAPAGGVGSFAAAAAAAKAAQEHAAPVEPMPSAAAILGTQHTQPQTQAAPAACAPDQTAPAAPVVAENFATGPMPAVVAEASATGPMQPVAAEPASTGAMNPIAAAPANATTAMPAIGAGNLDLDALRAEAAALGADAQPSADACETMPISASAEATQALPVELLQQRMAQAQAQARARELRAQAAAPHAAAASSAGMPVVPSAAIPQVEGEVPAVEMPSVKVGSLNLPPLDLPPINPPADPVVPAISPDDFKQRAPLAFTSEEEGGAAAAKSLLAMSLPSIDLAGADEEGAADAPKPLGATSAFAPIATTGAGSAVGDELLQNIDPDDLYVDDADDSAYETDMTETGAFAGPGYVDVPQSRIGKFFGKFRRKKNDNSSAQEWLGVDDDFDARRGGSKSGGWESFRDDDWEGGGFSNLRSRFSKTDAADADDSADLPEDGAPAYSEDQLDDVLSTAVDPMAAALEALAARDSQPRPFESAPMQQIYSFAAGDINTEIWFVALGSELMGNGGIKAFLTDHASEMRGAVVVNLESLGAGELCALDKEGLVKQKKASSRMKRYLQRALQASGVSVGSASINWRESAASFALKHRVQAVSIVGMDGAKPAHFAEADDVIENVNADLINERADFVVELLKNI